MKLVNLHNGKQMAFDDSMPDEAIDDLVKSLLGNDNEALKIQAMGAIVQGIAQAFVGLQKQNEQTAKRLEQTILGVANSLGALDKSVNAARVSFEQSTLLLAERLTNIAEAYSAPRHLTTDEDGNPIGVTIGKPKAH